MHETAISDGRKGMFQGSFGCEVSCRSRRRWKRRSAGSTSMTTAFRMRRSWVLGGFWEVLGTWRPPKAVLEAISPTSSSFRPRCPRKSVATRSSATAARLINEKWAVLHRLDVKQVSKRLLARALLSFLLVFPHFEALRSGCRSL